MKACVYMQLEMKTKQAVHDRGLADLSFGGVRELT